ncbi:MAG: hypothetical protein ACOCWT_00010 [Desulfohalobiaceae bacterium]
MTRQPNPATPDSCRMPFDGLGFELAAVRERAVLLVLKRVLRDDPARLMPELPLCARPFGYGLMTRLGREIRGR